MAQQTQAKGFDWNNPDHVNMFTQIASALGQGFDPNNPMAPVGQAAATTSAAGAQERLAQKKQEDFFRMLRGELDNPDTKSALSADGRTAALKFDLTSADGKRLYQMLSGLEPSTQTSEPITLPIPPQPSISETPLYRTQSGLLTDELRRGVSVPPRMAP